MTGYESKLAHGAIWFLFSEENEPLGQVYRPTENAAPTVGTRITNGSGWSVAQVVEFRELASACAMRRFRVVVRVVG